MNREERARQLILHHGGRNVSRAIRFLATELEKQKLHLFNQTNCQIQEQPQDESKEETNVRVGPTSGPSSGWSAIVTVQHNLRSIVAQVMAC